MEKNNHDNELAEVETKTNEAIAPVQTTEASSTAIITAPANTRVSSSLTETSTSEAPKRVTKKIASRTSNVTTATFETPVASKTSTEAFVPVADHVEAAESKAMSQVDMLVLVILALLIPPLAVYLHQGSWNDMCWISLLLTILFWIPGVVFAFLIILDII